MANAYKYGFNGKEKDDEVSGNGNHLSFDDYGYNPRIVRRWNIDPKTSSYPWQSPYIYAANNPILNIDIDGEGDITYIIKLNLETGKATFSRTELNPDKPDQQHYQIHYQNKDGSVTKNDVNSNAFFSTFKGLSQNNQLFTEGWTKIGGTKEVNLQSRADALNKTAIYTNEPGDPAGNTDDPFGQFTGNTNPEVSPNGGEAKGGREDDGFGISGDEKKQSEKYDATGFHINDNNGTSGKRFEEGNIFKDKKGDTSVVWDRETGKSASYNSLSQSEKQSLKKWTPKKDQ